MSESFLLTSVYFLSILFQTQMTGDVGTRRVIVKQDNTHGTTITITKHPYYTSTIRLRQLYDQVGDKVIIYQE